MTVVRSKGTTADYHAAVITGKPSEHLRAPARGVCPWCVGRGETVGVELDGTPVLILCLRCLGTGTPSLLDELVDAARKVARAGFPEGPAGLCGACRFRPGVHCENHASTTHGSVVPWSAGCPKFEPTS